MVMGKVLYIVAVILVVAWAISCFAFHSGGIIHILLAVAVIAAVLNFVEDRKEI